VSEISTQTRKKNEGEFGLNFLFASSKVIFFGTLIAGAFAYLFKVYFARSVSIEDFGLFYAVFSLVLFLSFFRDLGINSALPKFIPEFIHKGKGDLVKTAIFASIILQLFLSLVIVLVAFVSAHWLSVNYFGTSDALIIIIVLAAFFPISAIYNLLRASFRGMQRHKIFALLEPVKNLSLLMLLFIFLKLGLGALSAALATVVGILVVIPIFSYILFNTFQFSRYHITGFMPMAKKLVLFGIPVFSAAVAGQIIGHFDILMITYFLDIADVGIYSAVMSTALLLLLFAQSISSVVTPFSSSLIAKSGRKKASDIINTLVEILVILIAPIFFIFIVLSQNLIVLLFGQNFSPGSAAFSVLLVGVFFYSLAHIYNHHFIGSGDTKRVMKIFFFAAIINLFLNLIFIPIFGIIGAAVATSVSYFAMFIASYFANVSSYGNIRQALPERSMIYAIILVLAGILCFSVFSGVFLYIISTLILSIYLVVAYASGLIDMQIIKGLVVRK